MRILVLAAAAAVSVGLATPAAATGKMTCDAPQKAGRAWPASRPG